MPQASKSNWEATFSNLIDMLLNGCTFGRTRVFISGVGGGYAATALAEGELAAS